jgi:probable phosphoglycerate mutase
MTETLIDLIRHGEPVGGRAYRGHNIDDPLSDKGWQQMRSAVGSLVPWQQIVTSPMQRCQAFAEELADKHHIPMSIENDFREVGFGRWEGKSPNEVREHYQHEYDAFYSDPVNSRPLGAEPLDDFMRRVHDAYQSVIHQHSGQHVLIVAHAGVNRAIIAQALHCEPVGLYRIKVNNAGMTRLKHDPHGTHLLYHNCKLADMKS